MESLKTFIKQLQAFSEESWGYLQPCLSQWHYRRNEYLLKEGAVCNEVFFIESGFCKTWFNQDGKEINTGFNFENEFATSLRSLVSGTKSEFNIQACEPLSVIRFDKTELLKAYKKSHEIESFGRKVLELLNLQQEEHANSFRLLTPRERYEQLITRHPDFAQRVSLTQMASYLGISRETLSRLRALK